MPIPSDEKFLEILVHDLRSPLNVMKLTLHVVDEVGRQADVDLSEDVRIMRQNIDEMDRMLTTLVEFAQLPPDASALRPAEFEPSRLLRDLTDYFAETHPQHHLELMLLGGPSVAELDPELARLAWLRALENTAAAANARHPIRVVLSGGPGRCRVEMIAEGPPRDSVAATELRPGLFKRITGTAAERLGIDLATAARISELFGGSARLSVDPGQRACVVLDWPAVLRRGARG